MSFLWHNTAQGPFSRALRPGRANEVPGGTAGEARTRPESASDDGGKFRQPLIFLPLSRLPAARPAVAYRHALIRTSSMFQPDIGAPPKAMTAL